MTGKGSHSTHWDLWSPEGSGGGIACEDAKPKAILIRQELVGVVIAFLILHPADGSVVVPARRPQKVTLISISFYYNLGSSGCCCKPIT